MGSIRRVRRGIYDLPRPHPILGQTAPDPLEIVRALMHGSASTWQPSGAYAANLLHLSEQVPGKIVILTDGVSRRVKLESLTLDFRRTAPRNLLGAGTTAGLVIQAFRHLRATALTPKLLAKLRRQLDSSTKQDLRGLAPKLPAWMRPLIERVGTI